MNDKQKFYDDVIERVYKFFNEFCFDMGDVIECFVFCRMYNRINIIFIDL